MHGSPSSSGSAREPSGRLTSRPWQVPGATFQMQKCSGPTNQQISIGRPCDVGARHFGCAEARVAASIRATLEQAGTPIGPVDTRIAGTAVANRGVLITRNVREFGRVPGLTVQDWYA